MADDFDRIFPTDVLTKRERVERALSHEPVDRVPLQDQVSYNPGVVSLYAGRSIEGFDYSLEDVCQVVRRTLDACFPPVPTKGTERVTDSAGFVTQHDNWTSWTVSRPFDDVAGAREYLLHSTECLRDAPFDPDQARREFRERIEGLQRLVGDAVIIHTGSNVGLCACWARVGLELFSYLCADEPEVVSEAIRTRTDHQVRLAHAIASPDLSPVILIADDFATKQGPIFSPEFLRAEFFPGLRRLTEAWHEHGLKVLYHSDGNWRSVIPDLVDCGVDGFYCLEPAVGMDIVELKTTWPDHLWAGGVDGVDLMERGTPEQVAAEVRRHIRGTDALHSGGMFVGSSSEINPPIRPENYRAMVEAVGTMLNPDLT